jgi:DNA-binding IclR family transcriptional regulator
LDSEKESPVGGSTFVGSLAKGLQVLECFSNGRRDLGITEISRLTGIEKSAANRLVSTLNKLGYLTRNPQSRRYQLSPKSLMHAFNFLNGNPVIAVAMPRLVSLGERLGHSVSLCFLDDTDIIYAVRLERHRFYHPSGHIGERQPAYCTSSGRALLSQLPAEMALDVLKRSDRRNITPDTKTGLPELVEELRKVAAQTYCVQVGEFIRNEVNFAAPVLDGNRRPVAAVVISLIYRNGELQDLEDKIVPVLLHTVKEISSALGAPN